MFSVSDNGLAGAYLQGDYSVNSAQAITAGNFNSQVIAPVYPNPHSAYFKNSTQTLSSRGAEYEKCIEFMQKHVDQAYGPTPIYLKRLQEISDRESDCLCIELDHIEGYCGVDLVTKIEKNTLHYLEIFERAADLLLPPPSRIIDETELTVDEIFAQHRVLAQKSAFQLAKQHNPASVQGLSPESMVPSRVLRRFIVIFKTRSSIKSLNSIRALDASYIGSLVKVKAIVTRISEVKPKMIVATYTCSQCSGEVFQEIKSSSFMPISQCPDKECVKKNKTGAKLILQTRGSKFTKFQEVRIQELSSQVPMGRTPRSITVFIQGPKTGSCNPGDVVEIEAVYLPRVEEGFKALRTGLLAITYLEAFTVRQEKPLNQVSFQHSNRKSNDPHLEHMQISPEILTKVQELYQKHYELQQSHTNVRNNIHRRRHGNNYIYEILSQSIAPEIFGHTDVKKALLLLLVGGVGKELHDGMKIRGDMNICLMGDPGVAKSQLLKQACNIAARGIYTTGKGSSGVGLTASVHRDPITDEMMLEGGALVLADRGICAIDEFDKMEDGDRIAIYEVMEQQTISIAKAGIATTLNARASIVAAANPKAGRYNEKLSVKDNIDLPAALLSRFDLMFVLLDRPDPERDMELARHVTHVHTYGCAPTDRDDNNRFGVGRRKRRRGEGGGGNDLLSSSLTAAGQQDMHQYDEVEEYDDDSGFYGSNGSSNNSDSGEINGLVSVPVLRAAIQLCKSRNPSIPQSLTQYIIDVYLAMRGHSSIDDDERTTTISNNGGGGGTTIFSNTTLNKRFSRSNQLSKFESKHAIGATPRSLLAILRLSSALARLGLAESVSEDDVDEAVRLMNSSKASLLGGVEGIDGTFRDLTSRRYGGGGDRAISVIYEIIRGLINETPNKQISISAAQQACANAIRDNGRISGFNSFQFQETCQMYANLGVISIDQDNQTISLLQGRRR